jgi:hypothetical protein
MRRWVIFFGALCAAAGAACSLNPQPFPPDTADGSFLDAAQLAADAASDGTITGLDGGSGGPPPDADAASDATLDGSADVSVGDADASADADIQDADLGDGG